MKNIYLLLGLIAVLGLFGRSANAAIGISQASYLSENTAFTLILDDKGQYDQDDLTMKLMAQLSFIKDDLIIDSIQKDITDCRSYCVIRHPLDTSFR